MSTLPTSASDSQHVRDHVVVRTRTASTERAYAEDFARFTAWCVGMGAQALPADPMVVMFYLGHLAPTWRPATPGDPPDAVTRRGEVCESPGLAPGTLVRHLAAIAAHHLDAGYPDPTHHPVVVDMHGRIRDRAADGATRHRVAPAVPERLRALVADITAGPDADRDPAAARDAALILLGYVAALRPRELAGLTLDQIREAPDGTSIEVLAGPTPDTDTDTDTSGASRTHVAAVGGDACPVAAWRRWRAWLPDGDPGYPPVIPPRRGEEQDGDAPSRAGETGVPAFRSIRKGRSDLDGPAGRDAARRRIGTAALTERSLARIVSARARHAGLLGHWTADSLRHRDTTV